MAFVLNDPLKRGQGGKPIRDSLIHADADALARGAAVPLNYLIRHRQGLADHIPQFFAVTQDQRLEV